MCTTSCRKDMASTGNGAAPAQPRAAFTKASAPATPGKAANGAEQGATEKPVLGPVDLQAQPPHVHGQVDAFPLVLPGPAVTQAVANRINAALKREQAVADGAAEDCRKSYREQMHQAPTDDTWQRSVAVTFKGPRYLGFTATDTYFCGGPHPDGGSAPFVYDLATGSPVNWIRLFPAGAKPYRGNAVDGSVMGEVIWPVLGRRAVSGATADCEGAYSDPEVSFTISLDARAGELQADAPDVSHALQGCEDSETLTPDQLRKAGFAPELADALEAAHRLQH